MGSNLAQDVYNSVHFQFRSLWAKVDIPGAGSHGMLDRACGLPGTTLMANNYAGVSTSPVDGTKRDEGCGKCHVAYKPPYKYASFAEAQNDIDCLRCHATVYGAEWDDPANIALYGTNTQPHARKVVTHTDGSLTWSQDRSLKTAQSVGNLPKAKHCLRCHDHGYTGYKRATPFEPATDVHAEMGKDCRECHVMQQHKIARGNYVTDGMANELPAVPVDCGVTCHGADPHSLSAYRAQLNTHSTNMTCEACHIPDMAVPDNIFRRGWAPFTYNPVLKTWDATPVTTSGSEYPGYFDAYTEYHPLDAKPTLRWFDGGASMLAQPYGGYATRRSAGGDSRLFAFKPFVSGMVFDAGWLPGPPADYSHVTQTWPFSMKSFYENNWPKFVQFGFIDPLYQTAAQ
jgi:hypothetical protein